MSFQHFFRILHTFQQYFCGEQKREECNGIKGNKERKSKEFKEESPWKKNERESRKKEKYHDREAGILDQ